MNVILRYPPTGAARAMASYGLPTRFLLPHTPSQAALRRPRTLTTTCRRLKRSLPAPKRRIDPGRQSADTPPPPPPPPPPRAGPIPKHDIVVGAVVGTCITIYAVHTYYTVSRVSPLSLNAPRVLRWFNRNMALSSRNIAEGRYYTLLTSTLTHYGLIHLGLNMLALWGFGRSIVSLYGVTNFAIIWIGSGISGGYLQTFLWRRDRNHHPDQKALGASGSILGMITVTACAMPYSMVQFLIAPVPSWVAAGVTAGFSAAALNQGWLPGLGHAAHLGGMAFGAAWWLLMLRRGRGAARFLKR